MSWRRICSTHQRAKRNISRFALGSRRQKPFAFLSLPDAQNRSRRKKRKKTRTTPHVARQGRQTCPASGFFSLLPRKSRSRAVTPANYQVLRPGPGLQTTTRTCHHLPPNHPESDQKQTERIFSRARYSKKKNRKLWFNFLAPARSLWRTSRSLPSGEKHQLLSVRAKDGPQSA